MENGMQRPLRFIIIFSIVLYSTNTGGETHEWSERTPFPEWFCKILKRRVSFFFSIKKISITKSSFRIPFFFFFLMEISNSFCLLEFFYLFSSRISQYCMSTKRDKIRKKKNEQAAKTIFISLKNRRDRRTSLQCIKNCKKKKKLFSFTHNAINTCTFLISFLSYGIRERLKKKSNFIIYIVS